MAVLPLQIWPAEVLRRQAEPVGDDEFGDALAQTLDDMAETMYVENGIGLAAPQVAISKRMLVMDVPMGDDRKPDLKALVNPEIVESQGTIVYEEGCLSFPGLTADVKRHGWIRVAYRDAWGKAADMVCEGLEAVCLQHEMDHLDGINFVDHLSPLKRKLLLRELKKNLADRAAANAS